MKPSKYLFPLLIVMNCVSMPAFAANVSSHDDELHERDFDALQQYIDTKRIQEIDEQGQDQLAITGDIRTEWRHMNEFKKGRQQIGPKGKDCACIPRSHNDFDIEFNLRFDYVGKRTWAAAHLQFDNSAGIENAAPCCCTELVCQDRNVCDAKGGRKVRPKNRFHGSGSFGNLELKRAYMGYNVYKDCGRLDVELGRRRLYDYFESDIQFLSTFDGLSMTYSNSYEPVGSYYFKIAGFVVDERVNHFAWATEIALFDIYDLGLDFKYSFIDWEHFGHDRCGRRNPKEFKYLNSQFTLTYHIPAKTFCVWPIEIYGAFLVNHAAHKLKGLNKRHRSRGMAWYVGCTVGEVEGEGDWSINVVYEWVQANAIAFDDQSGIGLLDSRADCCGQSPTPGYKGWRVEGLYAITDHLSLNPIIEAARSNQGRRHTYSKFELEAIYAF